MDGLEIYEIKAMIERENVWNPSKEITLTASKLFALLKFVSYEQYQHDRAALVEILNDILKGMEKSHAKEA